MIIVYFYNTITFIIKSIAMDISEESSVDFKILNFITPPQLYPPTYYDICSQIEDKFYN
jgi:hypothetical protein